jgi:glycosidase
MTARPLVAICLLASLLFVSCAAVPDTASAPRAAVPVTTVAETASDPLPPGIQSLGMAGTFNNWNTGDRSTHMTFRDGAWSLVRVFPGGDWKFKFVMNNGWDLHRGLGENDQLDQPGRDIPLVIPRTAFYRVELDLDRATWRLAEAPGETAIADVAYTEDHPLGREIRLDASGSIPRAGRNIQAYRWRQDPRDAARLAGLPRDSRDPVLVVKPETEGLYRLHLMVDDGAPGMDFAVTLRVRASYQIVDRAGVLHDLERGEDGLFRRVMPLAAGEDFPFQLTRNFDATRRLGPSSDGRTDLEAAFRAPMGAPGRWITIAPGRAGLAEIAYDPRTNELAVRRSARTRILFDPARAAERLKGVTIERVALAGGFNNWSAEATPMTRRDNGAYESYLDLADGVHHYKVVVNGSIWLANPLAPTELEAPDGHGGVNSGVLAGERGADFGAPGPGFLLAAIRHDPNDEASFNAFSRGLVEVRIRVREGDVSGIDLLLKRGPDVERLPMTRLFSRSGFDHFSVDAPTRGEEKLAYLFELRDGATTLLYPENGARLFEREIRVGFHTPDWAKNVVWYQIMPDRWRNADPRNDPDSTVPWRWDWFKPFTEGESRAFYGADGIWHRLYGGDLAGLITSLDYLVELGVTGLYLNPVFEATSHHKYNTSDYRHIDNHFGTKGDIQERWQVETADSRTWAFTRTDSLFLDFLRLARERGFKVIVDGVFNHSGTEFWAFQDLVRNGRNSPYRDWFKVKEWDVAPAEPGAPTFIYEGWAGFAGLPEFAQDENGLVPGIRDHIFDVTRRWMDPNGDGDPSDGVDGWRLDVPECVVEPFWREWRRVVKGVNPDAYISAEIWENAAHRLRGDHYDAVMNYEFQKRMYGFFLPGGTTPALKPSALARSMEEMLAWYPRQVNLVLQNLLGSHDVDRIVSAIHNRAGWKRGRVQDENPSYDTGPPGPGAYEILKQITAFQMTWPGAPMIYYGDEVGMYGADDPTNRKPMWWEGMMPYDNPNYRFNLPLRNHFRQLIAIRNTYPALRTGPVRFLLADDEKNVIAFERWDARNRIVTVINNSDQFVVTRLPLTADRQYVDILQPRNARLDWGRVEELDAARKTVNLQPSAVRLKPDADGALSLSLVPRGSAILLELAE